MEEVASLLAAHRLVTLKGAGGIGKTRLALESAREALDDYPDGVWLVELAALADAAVVPSAVASALDLREVPGRPLVEALVEGLREQLAEGVEGVGAVGNGHGACACACVSMRVGVEGEGVGAEQ